jgi:hypothetical protein
MWEPQPLTTLRASKACRGENFTFYFNKILFADNQVLLLNTKDHLQKNITKLSENTKTIYHENISK